MGEPVLKLSKIYDSTPDTNPCYTGIETYIIHSRVQQPIESKGIVVLSLCRQEGGSNDRRTEKLHSRIQRIVLEHIGRPMKEIQQSVDGLIKNSGVELNELYKVTERDPKSRYVFSDYDGILRKKDRDCVWTYRGMAMVRSLVKEQVPPLEFDKHLKFKVHYVFQRKRTQERKRKRIQK